VTQHLAANRGCSEGAEGHSESRIESGRGLDQAEGRHLGQVGGFTPQPGIA